MKTHTIKTPTAELLIAELPRKADVEIFPNSIEIYNQFTGQEETIKGSYTLLGSPDEIREEDARELVKQSIHTHLFAHYVKGIPVNTYCYKTATKSLLSLLETEIYWNVNPIKLNPIQNERLGDIWSDKHSKWLEAELRTFDRNRSLIFVKN